MRRVDNSTRRRIGVFITCAGIWVFIIYLNYPTTVTTERKYIEHVGTIGGEEVHNLGLLVNRMLGRDRKSVV